MTRKRKLVIILAVVMAVCAVIAGILAAMFYLSYDVQVSETLEVNREYDFASGGTLRINAGYADVEIIPYDGDKLFVLFSGTMYYNELANHKPELAISGSKGNVTVNERYVGRSGVSFGSVEIMSLASLASPGRIEGKYTIYVPHGQTGDISVSTGGQVKIDGLDAAQIHCLGYNTMQITGTSCKSLYINGGNGDITLNACNINGFVTAYTVEGAIRMSGVISGSDVRMDSFSGDISMSNVRGSTIYAYTTYGKLDCNMLEAKTVQLYNNNGEIKALNTGTNNLFIQSDSGDVTATLSRTCDVNIMNGSGDVSLTIPESEGFRFSGRTYSGRCTLPESVTPRMEVDETVSFSMGSAIYMVEVQTDSGNIEVLTTP